MLRFLSLFFVISLLVMSCGVRGPLVPPKKPISFFDIEKEKPTEIKESKGKKIDENK